MPQGNSDILVGSPCSRACCTPGAGPGAPRTSGFFCVLFPVAIVVYGMLIVLLIVVVLGLAAAAGFLQGAIRSLVTLVGVFLGMMLASPLGVHLKPLVPKVGLEHPVWSWFIPQVTVFVLFVLAFAGIAFAVHRQVALYFKYKTDEYQMQSWERLNKRLGICVGLFTGSIYVVLLSVSIYVVGYLTTQVTAGENDPALLRFVSQARQEMVGNGMDKLVARFDPMKDDYYLASDVFGLLHRNPLLEARVADYPFFLSLAERQEFKDLGSDKEFQTLRERQPSLGDIINHPKVAAMMGNEELLGVLRQIDLKDLTNYLQTGKSPKYDDEKILGRWRMDPTPTVRELRKLSPNMTATEFAQAKKLVNMIAPLVSVTSAPDKKFILKLNAAELSKQISAIAAAVAPPPAVAAPVVVVPPPEAQASAGGGMSAQMRQRYGLGKGSPTPQPAPAPVIVQAAPPRSAAPKATGGKMPSLAMITMMSENLKKVAEQQPMITTEGSWERDGDKYTVKMQDPSGKSQEVEATADDERMVVTIPIIPPMKATLVFVKL